MLAPMRTETRTRLFLLSQAIRCIQVLVIARTNRLRRTSGCFTGPVPGAGRSHVNSELGYIDETVRAGARTYKFRVRYYRTATLSPRWYRILSGGENVEREAGREGLATLR